MKFIKKLEGENIYLAPRVANEEIVEKFTEWLNDFQVTDYTGRSSQVVTIDGEREYLESKKSDSVNLYIIEKETDTLLGTIALERIDNINRKATLGIFIGESNTRNKGYGTESIKLILDYGFNYLNLNNIDLRLMSFNDRAYRCYEKCGFKEFGRRRNSIYINGKYYDEIYMDILAEEFVESYIKNKNI